MKLSLALSLSLVASLSLAACVDDEDLGQDDLALARYRLVSAETSLTASSTKQLSVACPRKTRALGAGWAVLDGTNAILDGVATHFAPSYDGTSWLVNARNTSTFAPSWKLRVTVTCGSDALAGYQVLTTETATDTASVKQAAPACPAGTSSVGAGWAVLDPTGAILDGEATYFEPSYDGTSWLVNARNNSGFAPSWKLRTHVICASTSALAGYQVMTGETAATSATVKQLAVACPAGTFATSAGWGVLDDTSAILTGEALHAAPSFDGTSWLTNARNLSGFAPTWKLQARALCVP